MAADRSQRVALWLYRQARRAGVLSLPPARWLYARAYAHYKRHVEDPFHNLAVRHAALFRGGHILDVGANLGYTAGVFAAAIQAPYRVWAFEPAAENFARLQASIAERGFEEVIVARRVAVADRAGTADLVLNPDHPGDHRMMSAMSRAAPHVERVPVTTIDDEVRAHGIVPVALIKIDVQGYELHVCRGMTVTLDANRAAAIVVEYTPALLRSYGVEPQAFLQFFAERGYLAYQVTQPGRLEPVDPARLAHVMPSRGYVDLLFTRTPQGRDA